MPATSLADLDLAIKHLTLRGIPFSGGGGVRHAEQLRAACGNRHLGLAPKDVAFISLLLLVRGGFDDQRHSVVDGYWTGLVNRILRVAAGKSGFGNLKTCLGEIDLAQRAADDARRKAEAAKEEVSSLLPSDGEKARHDSTEFDHALENLAVLTTAAAAANARLAEVKDRPAWIMLSALKEIATTCARLTRWEANELFDTAAPRLWPGMAAASLAMTVAREEVAAGLRKCIIPLPEPWTLTALPATTDSAYKGIVEHLRTIYDKPEGWLGKDYSGALRAWFGAIHQPGTDGVVAPGAVATLKCMGGKRVLTRNPTGAFFEAVHAWSLQEWCATADGSWKSLIGKHLERSTHVELIVRGLARMCGLGANTPLPVPHRATPPETLRGILTRVIRISDGWYRTFPSGRYTRTAAYRPAGYGVVVGTRSEVRAARRTVRTWRGDPALLAALYLLHEFCGQIGLVPAAKHGAQASLYQPLADALRSFGSAQARCGYLKPAPQRTADSIAHLWLAGGYLKESGLPALPNCFFPTRIGRTPPPAHLAAAYGSTVDFAGLRRHALLLIELLTHPLHAAASTDRAGGFGRETYSFIEGALRSSRAAPPLAASAALMSVLNSHVRLFQDLAEDNIQHRVRIGFMKLHCLPLITGCPICRL